MRLSKIELILLAVAVMAVVCFSAWLQGEMHRAGREREQARHDIGSIVETACADLSAAELDSSDSGRLQCGSIVHQSRPDDSSPAALTTVVNANAGVPDASP